MSNAVYVVRMPGGDWVVQTDDDSAPPVSEHPDRGEAETAARSYATTFGIPQVIVRHENGEQDLQLLDPDPQPPSPGAATGPSGDLG